MSRNLYPEVGSSFVAYSVSQFLKVKSLPHEKFYLCGRLQPLPVSVPLSKSAPQETEVEGFMLWSQQGQFQIETEARLEWQEAEGKWGDWVAVLIEPGAIKRENGLKVRAQQISVKRLVAQQDSQVSNQVPADAKSVRLRAKFLNTLRSGLLNLGLEEVETPYLVACPGMEPTLEPFMTEWKWGEHRQNFYLPTSPELHLKKLLAQGWTDIFEIKTCFRNSELSEHHEPEFLMLEWYRAFKTLDQIKADIRDLLDGFYDAGLVKGSRPQLRETTYADLFQRFLKFDLKPQTTKSELEELCRQNLISFSATDSWDDLFFRLSLEKIEPRLAQLGPLVIKNFPPSQVALARFTADGWADRFEFYWQGLEIANAFHELNDPVEQEKRIQTEIALRQQLGTAPLKPDLDFLEHLKSGMPPSSGVALGVERLLMACQGETQLKNFRAFSFKNQLQF